ncbi:MAG TPA: hypothetical protein VJ144_02580 [Candidatus Polarisedimenticolia bacterium]|nr:hypothetical protein [Candidatus Polarisedimenticolia bacterium]
MSRATLLGVALLCAAFPPRAAGRATSLTNEDIVRMVIAKTREEDILKSIAARPVDFDLAPDMIGELRIAGVSDSILEAMRRRQAEMPRPEIAPTPTPHPASSGTLEIDFVDEPAAGDPAERSAIALRSLPTRVTRRGGMEVGEVTELALAVLCLTADHVPDHWDTRTPLTGAPRHELLLFRPASAEETLRRFKILYLKHDTSYRVDLPEGPHNIVVAAAGKSAGSGAWRLIASDGARVTIARESTTRLAVKAHGALRGNAMVGYAVENEWKISSIEEPRAAGAGAAATPARPSPAEGVAP